MSIRALRSLAARLIGVCVTLMLASALHARDAEPRFAPDAVPIGRATEYLRKNAAPDYWAISPLYIAQETDSDCSVASATIVLNVLRGIPMLAEELITPRALVAAVKDQQWIG